MFLAAFHLTTIDNVLMTNNLAIGNGGGVSGHSRCTISRSVFLYNTGSFGGGVVLAYPNSTLSHSNLHWNNATRNGGGLSCLSRGMVINNVTITENSARNAGGGVEVIFQADVSFYNSTVSSNRAVSKGGGIVIYDSIVRFQNSLIWYTYALALRNRAIDSRALLTIWRRRVQQQFSHQQRRNLGAGVQHAVHQQHLVPRQPSRRWRRWNRHLGVWTAVHC